VLLVVKSAGVVAVKVAFSKLLVDTGSAVVVQVAVPELTGWDPHPVIVAGELPYVKFTVPAAPVPVTVAVNVTLVP
jgi:hypothetical protein